MKRLSIVLLAVLCMGQQQNCGEDCSCGKFKEVDASKPGIITYTCDCGTEPTPTPTPGPTPSPTPHPTPEPTPPQCDVPTTSATIDARCAGGNPNCGISGASKTPVVHRGSTLWFDLTYKNAQGRAVHDGPCYPGAPGPWTPSRDCYSWNDGHSLTCSNVNSNRTYVVQTPVGRFEIPVRIR